jgi:hypothetical protein
MACLMHSTRRSSRSSATFPDAQPAVASSSVLTPWSLGQGEQGRKKSHFETSIVIERAPYRTERDFCISEKRESRFGTSCHVRNAMNNCNCLQFELNQVRFGP